MQVTRETYITDLPLSIHKDLSLRLDKPSPTHNDWRGMAALLPRRPGSNELKYNALQISRFELELQRHGGSPTKAVIEDWGTCNARVSHLLEVFRQMDHHSAMDALLPGSSRDQIHQENCQPRPNPRPRLADPPPEIPKRPVKPTKPKPTGPADSTTRLPQFNPQIVQRFRYQEMREMTRNFDERKVQDGGTLIDEGGFGVVYRGRFSNDEPCAIKRLKEVKEYQEIDVEKQFDAELKALCKLRHPNLVILYGYCYEPPNLCLVYELMTGGSLQERLSWQSGGNAPLSWPRRIGISLDAASGIRHLHERNFIHRDIKSGNILLDGNLTAKVCDFGLVRDKSDRLGSGTTRFQTSVTIGSTAYMAPEAHHGNYSKKTDVYSFGLVLLEILTGWPVIEAGQHISARVYDLMEQTKDDVRELVDQCAEFWDENSIRVVYDLAINSTDQKERRRPDICKIAQDIGAVQAPTPVK